jgi:hypothetical protein
MEMQSTDLRLFVLDLISYIPSSQGPVRRARRSILRMFQWPDVKKMMVVYVDPEWQEWAAYLSFSSTGAAYLQR